MIARENIKKRNFELNDLLIADKYTDQIEEAQYV